MEKTHNKKRKASRVVLFVLFAVLFLVFINFSKVYYQNILVKKEIKELEEQVKNLEKRKLESLSLLRYVESDSFVEESARVDLNLQKEGEKVLLLIEDNAILPKEEGSKSPLLANPMKWILFFTGYEKN